MVAPNDQFQFTKQILNTLPLPEQGKRFSFKDSKERGLIIRTTANGQKTFQLYQKHQGRPVRVTLGIYPDMSIENARKAALKAKNSLAEGKNPNVEKNKLRQEITLRELFRMFMDKYSKLQKKTWQEDEKEIPRFLSHWFNRRISSISKHEIANLHVKVRENNGLYQANRVLERICTMYNKAIEWGWDGANPTQGIKKFKEKSRDRYILPEEIPLFIRALDDEENETAKDFFYIALLTGARKTNVLQMRWEQIDWHNQTWRIPDTKNDEPVVIPLTSRAIDILNARLKRHHNKPWVFPSEDSEKGHYSDPKKAWNRIRQRATLSLWKKNPEIANIITKIEDQLQTQDNYGYTILKLFNTVQSEAEECDIELPIGLMDIRLHDIRRTFGSYQAITGASLQIIGKSLGHKSSEATQIYARLHNDPVKDSIERGTEAMFGLAENKDGN